MKGLHFLLFLGVLGKLNFAKRISNFDLISHSGTLKASSHPVSSTAKPDETKKLAYPYKMQSLGHNGGIKNTYQGESYGNIFIINHPGYGNDIVIHNYPAGGSGDRSKKRHVEERTKA